MSLFNVSGLFKLLADRTVIEIKEEVKIQPHIYFLKTDVPLLIFVLDSRHFVSGLPMLYWLSVICLYKRPMMENI